jgi:3-deoxy-D-manno-octulosonate 8-phosphate phosphatase (KDO 8-P phosphatase)
VSAEGLKLLVFDVDGVLTDGQLYFSSTGEETKAFNARDGVGMKYLMRFGVECAFLSGRESPPVQRRAENLGIQHVITGAKDKEPELRRLVSALGLSMEEVGYVGDDLMDLPPMRVAGWSACPADAVAEVRGAADFVTASPGGAGAVREIAEHVLRAQGKWEAVMARYHGE